MAGQMVSFPSNGGTAQGYLATPASGKGPGVVVIQEWWGLNDNIKGIADRFAAAGYLALAPDLYHGKVVSEPDDAMKAMMALKMDAAAKDIVGAVGYLKSNPAGNGKVGTRRVLPRRRSLALSLDADARRRDGDLLRRAAGRAAGPHEAQRAGARDTTPRTTTGRVPAVAAALEKQLKDLGKTVEFHQYAGTHHGFFNDTRPEAHDAAASQQTWDRTLAFYKQHLA